MGGKGVGFLVPLEEKFQKFRFECEMNEFRVKNQSTNSSNNPYKGYV